MKDLITSILNETDYKNNPYFIGLQNGDFSKEDFIETQIQFFFAVVFFNRPMAALAAKIPSAELRLEILKNVWEEHGEGSLSMTHENTFLTFLNRLGNVTAKDINERTLWPEIRIFNTCLTGACVMDDYLVGTALLGIIELMFCHISSILADGVINRGWLVSDKMIHYNLHLELDIKHSQDFFNILEASWKDSIENKYLIEQGLRLGATLFNNLYYGLYQNRKKRLNRSFLGPHSKAEGYTIKL